MTELSNPPADGSSRAPRGVELWLLLSASLSAGGWLLSALGRLNARGYVCYLVLLLVAWAVWRRGKWGEDFQSIRWHRLVRRFRRPLPIGFLVLALLSLMGGLLYLPTNYDALAYRVPRVLHWLSHGQWHWVHTDFPRLNVRACGYEWLMAPLLVFTKTTHWLFLPSIISFLLLPGLFYSVFIRFGVRRKVAWHWMWIAATGYGYVTQAGSIANDLMSATLVLAAYDFGLRLGESGKLRDLWFFVIAFGLVTGAKASNFPILLPLFLIVIPSWQLLLARPIRTFLVILFAALASFLPTAIFNWHYAGDWTGMKLEGPMQGPLAQLVINFFSCFIVNLSPPIFPFAHQWMALMGKIPDLSATTANCFGIGELAIEEDSGLGAGVWFLLIISLWATRRLRRAPGGNPGPALTRYSKWILWSPLISLLVFGLKAQAVHSASRLIIPYYAALIIPFLVYGFDARLLRQRWWNGLVAFVFAVAILITILLPARPLWPARSLLAKLKAAYPSSRLIARSESVYDMYANRPTSFAPLIAALPQDVTVFGMLTFDDPEASLWWPMGSRRIEHITPEDTRAQLEARGINYILAPSYCAAYSLPVEKEARKLDAEVVKKVPLCLRTVPGNMDWYILKISPKTAVATSTRSS